MFQFVCDCNVTPISSDNKLGKNFSYSCKYGTYFIQPMLTSCHEQQPWISHEHNTALHFMNLYNICNLVELIGPWIKRALSLVYYLLFLFIQMAICLCINCQVTGIQDKPQILSQLMSAFRLVKFSAPSVRCTIKFAIYFSKMNLK